MRHIRDGSIWQHLNDRNVPYLDINDNERKLNLNWWSNDWNGNYRFLAVRNSLWHQSPRALARGLVLL